MLESIFTFFSQTWVSLLFGELILVGGLLHWLGLRWWRLRPVQAQLAEAIQLLSEQADGRAFAVNFSQIDRRLSENHLLARSWVRYRNGLQPPRGPGLVTAVRDPGAFFHFDSLVGQQLDHRTDRAVPGYLAGLGVLITLMALISGLFEAGGDLTAATASSQLALGVFLNAISLKLFPSLAGIFCGLFSFWGQRYQYRKLAARIDHFQQLLLERIDLLSVEGPSVAAEGAGSEERLLAGRDQLLGRIVTHLDLSMAALKDKIVQSVHTAVEPLMDGIRLEGEKLIGLREESLEDLVDRVTWKAKTRITEEMGLLDPGIRLDAEEGVATEGAEPAPEPPAVATGGAGVKKGRRYRAPTAAGKPVKAVEPEEWTTRALEERFTKIFQTALTPVIDTVRRETAILVTGQERMIREAFAEMTTRLAGPSPSPGISEKMIAAFRAEGGRLADIQERVVREGLSEVADRLRGLLSRADDRDGTGEAADGEGTAQRLAERFVLEVMDRLRGALFLDPVIATLRAEGERLTRHNQQVIEEVLQQAGERLQARMDAGTRRLDDTWQRMERTASGLEELAERSERLSPADVRELVRLEADRIREQFKDFSHMLPLLEELRQQGKKLAEHQDRSLRELLDEIVVRGADGGESLDPVLAAVKAEGRRQLDRQRGMVRESVGEALGEAVDDLKKTLAPGTDTILDTVRSEVARLESRLDAERAAGRSELSLEPVLETVRVETARLMERLETSLATDGSDALDPVLSSLQEEISHLSERLDAGAGRADLSLDPVMEALRQQGAQLVENQSRLLREAFDSVPAAAGEGTLEPALMAVKEEGERLLERQRETVQRAFEGVVENLRESFFPYAVIDALKGETARLADHLEERGAGGEVEAPEPALAVVRADVAALGHRLDKVLAIQGEQLSLAPVLESVRVETARLMERLETSLAADDSGALDPVLTSLQEEIAHLSKRLDSGSTASEASLEPVMAALREQGSQLVENQSRMLREAFDSVAVRGADGGVTLEPIIAAVKSEGERLLERQREAVRQAFDGVVDNLRESFLPFSVIDALKGETARLADRLEAREAEDDLDALEPALAVVRADVAELGQRLNRIQEATRELLDRQPVQEVLEAVVREGDGEARLDPVLAAVKADGNRQLRRQEEAMRDSVGVLVDEAVAELKKSLAPDTDGFIEAVRSENARLEERLMAGFERSRPVLSLEPILESVRVETARLMERLETSLATDGSEALGPVLESLQAEMTHLSEHLTTVSESPEISLEPVMEALRRQSDQLVESQSQALREAFDSVAVRGADGDISLEPVLAAVKAEGARLLERQNGAVRDSFKSVVEELRESFLPYSVIDALKGETARLVEHLEGEAAGDSGTLEAAVEAVRAEMGQLRERIGQLSSTPGEISLDPILSVLEKQGREQAVSQSEALREVLESVAVRGTDGAISLDPILAAVNAAGEQQLQRQREVVRETVGEVISDLKISLAPEVIEAVRSENARLEERIVAGLEKSRPVLSLEPILDSVRVETARLMERLETSLATDGSEALGPVLESLQAEMTHLSEHLTTVSESPEISLEPVMEALRRQSDQLVESQSQALREAFDSVAVRGADGDISLEPVLAAVKAEGARLLERQNGAVRDSFKSVVEELRESFLPYSVIDALKGETARLVEHLEGEAAGDSGTLEAAVEAVRAEMGQLRERMDQISTATPEISLDPILSALEKQGRELAASQSKALHEALEAVAVRGSDGTFSLDPILAAVQSAGEQQLQRQRQVVRDSVGELVGEAVAELKKSIEGSRPVLSLEPILDSVRVETARLMERLETSLATDGSEALGPVLESLQAEMTHLSEHLTTVSESPEISLEPVMEALRRQSDQLVESQSQALREAFDSVAVRGADGDISLEPVLAAVKAEGARLLERQNGAVRDSFKSVVEELRESFLPYSVIDALKGETARLVEHLEGEAAGDSGTLEAAVEAVRAEMGQLRERIDRVSSEISINSLLTTIQEQGRELADSQSRTLREALESVAVRGTDGTLSLDPVLAAVKAAGEQQLQQVIEAVRSENARLEERIVAGLEKSRPVLSLEPILDSVRVETARLMERLETSLATDGSEALGPVLESLQAEMTHLSEHLTTVSESPEISLEPVMEALRRQSDQLVESQSQALREAFDSVAVRGADGDISLEPVLAAVKAEGARLLERQNGAVRDSFKSVVEELRESFLPYSVIDALKGETARLVEHLEGEAAGDSGTLEAAVEAVRAEMGQLRERIEHISATPPEISLDAILATLEKQGREMAENQSRILRETLEAVAVRGTDGSVSLDPILAAVNAAGERQLQRQRAVVRDVMETVAGDLKKSFAGADILRAVKEEGNYLANRMDEEWSGDRLVAGEELARVREEIAALTERIDQGVNTGYETLQPMLEMIHKDILTVTDGLRGGDVPPGSELQALRRETERLAQSLESEPRNGESLLEPVLAALREQSLLLAESQSNALQEVLNDVAVRGGDGEVALDPLLAAVKAEGERLRDHQADTLGVVKADLATIRAESQRLAQRLAAEPAGRATDLETVLTALREQSQLLAESQSNALQEALGDIAVRGGDGEVALDPLLAAVKAEGERLFDHQQTVLGTIKADLEAIRRENTDVGSGALDLEPVLTALREQSQLLAESQSSALQEVLGDVAVRGGDGEVGLDPLLAAVKAEGERLLDHQRTVLETITADLQAIRGENADSGTGTIDLEPVLTALREQSVLLAESQSNALQEMLGDVAVRGGDGEVGLDPLLAAVKAEGERLLDRQRHTLGTVKADLEAIRADTVRMAQRLEAGRGEGTVDLEPMLAALREQSLLLAESQSNALQEVLSDVAVRGGDGEVGLDPLLAAVKAEGERLLSHQEETLGPVVADLGAVRERTEALQRHLEEQPLRADLDSIRQQIGDLSQRLQADIDDRVHLEPALEMTRGQMASLIERLEAGPGGQEALLEPVLDALKEQTARLAENQSLALSEVLGDVAVRGLEDTPALDPLLAAIKSEGERLLVRQESTIDGLAADLATLKMETAALVERLETGMADGVDNLAPMLELMHAELTQLSVRLEGERGAAVSELGSTLEAVRGEIERLAGIQEQTAQRLSAVVEPSLEPLLVTLREQGQRLAEEQVRTIQETLGAMSVRGESGGATLEPVLVAMKVSEERFLERQETAVRDIMMDLATGLDQIRGETGRLHEKMEQARQTDEGFLDRLMSLIQTESAHMVHNTIEAVQGLLADSGRGGEGSSPEPLVEVIHQEMARLGEIHALAIRDAIGDAMRGMPELLSMEPMVAVVREEIARAADGQTALIHETMTRMESASTDLISLDPVLEAIQVQGALLAETHVRALNEIMTELEVRGSEVRMTQDLMRSLIHEQLQERIREPILEAIHTLTEELAGRQDGAIHAAVDRVSTEIDRSLAATDWVDALKAETARLSQQVSETHALESVAIESVMEAIKSQSDLRLEERTRSLREAVGEIAEPGSGVERFLENVLRAVQETSDRILVRMAELPKPESFNTLIRAENDRLLQQLREKTDIGPLVESLEAERRALAGEQSEALRATASEIIDGMRRAGTAEPVIEALRAEGERLTGQLESRPTLEELRGVLRHETERLLEGQERLVESQNYLASTQGTAIRDAVADAGLTPAADGFSLEPVLQAIRDQGDRLSAEQKNSLTEALDRIAVRDADGAVRVDPVLAAVKAENQRVLQHQETVRRSVDEAVDDLKKSLDPLRLIETFKTEAADLTTRLAERLQPAEISLQPVLMAIEKQGVRITEGQSRALRDALDAVAVRGEDGSLTLDPVLAAVKAEGERQLLEQGRTVQRAVGEMTDTLKHALDPAPVIDTVKETGARLEKRLEAGPDDPQRTVEPVLAAIREQGERTRDQNERLEQSRKRDLREALEDVAVRDETGRITVDPILAALKAEIARLGQELRGDPGREALALEPVIRVLREETTNLARAQQWMIQETLEGTRDAMEPVLKVLKDQNAELAERHDRTLRYVLDDLAIRAADQPLEGILEPLLEAVRTELDLLLRRQERTIREGLDGVAVGVEGTFYPQLVIDTIREETARLAERLAAPDGTGATTVAPLLEPAITALRQETANLADIQRWLIEEARSGVQLSLEPVMHAIQEQGNLLTSALNRSLREILTERIGEEGIGAIDLESILTAVKREGDRLLQQQGELTRRESERLTQRLNLGPSGADVIDAVHRQGDRLSEALHRQPVPERPSDEALERATGAAGIDGASLLELLQSMSLFLTGRVGLEIAPINAVLTALIAKLQQGVPVYDPEVIGHLKEFGDRSAAYLHSATMDADTAREWDKGFMKAAIALQGYVHDLAKAYSLAMQETSRSTPSAPAPEPAPERAGTRPEPTVSTARTEDDGRDGTILRQGVAGVFEELEKSLFDHFIKRSRRTAPAGARRVPPTADRPGRTTVKPTPTVAARPPATTPEPAVAKPVIPEPVEPQTVAAEPVAPEPAPPAFDLTVQLAPKERPSSVQPPPSPPAPIREPSLPMMDQTLIPEPLQLVKSLPRAQTSERLPVRSGDYKMKDVIFAAYQDNLRQMESRRR